MYSLSLFLLSLFLSLSLLSLSLFLSLSLSLFFSLSFFLSLSFSLFLSSLSFYLFLLSYVLSCLSLKPTRLTRKALLEEGPMVRSFWAEPSFLSPTKLPVLLGDEDLRA